MDAIHAVAPQVPFLLEGTGQSGIGANWGDGFATDPQLVKSKGLSDPTLFFQVSLDLCCSCGLQCGIWLMFCLSISASGCNGTFQSRITWECQKLCQVRIGQDFFSDLVV